MGNEKYYELRDDALNFFQELSRRSNLAVARDILEEIVLLSRIQKLSDEEEK